MYTGKSLLAWLVSSLCHWILCTHYPHFVTQWKFSDGENLAHLNYYIPDEKHLHLPESLMSVKCAHNHYLATYLRPTAASFRSDRQSRNRETRMATAASKIEPILGQSRPPFSSGNWQTKVAQMLSILQWYTQQLTSSCKPARIIITESWKDLFARLISIVDFRGRVQLRTYVADW